MGPNLAVTYRGPALLDSNRTCAAYFRAEFGTWYGPLNLWSHCMRIFILCVKSVVRYVSGRARWTGSEKHDTLKYEPKCKHYKTWTCIWNFQDPSVQSDLFVSYLWGLCVWELLSPFTSALCSTSLRMKAPCKTGDFKITQCALKQIFKVSIVWRRIYK